MKAPYERISGAMMWHDPRNLQWRRRLKAPLPSRLEAQLARLRSGSTLSMLGRSMADTFERFQHLARTPTFGTVDQLTCGDRRPLVLAHGPSLATLLPVIRKHRDRLFVIAPMRTALHLAARDIWADLVVLADRGTTPYAVTEASWSETPAAAIARLSRLAAVLVEPFAPAGIYEGFDRVVMLDDGTGLGGGGLPLPFWGYALVASVALPLALGSSSVAVGGIDVKAATGRARRTWRGEPARIDSRFATLLGLLEILSVADRTLVDVSPDSLSKRGFIHEPLDRYARRRPASAAASATAVALPHVALPEVLAELLEPFEQLAPVVASMRATVKRGLRLLEASDTAYTRRELAGVLDTMERRWPEDWRFHTAMTLMQPAYLMMLIQLRKMDVRPVNVVDAVRRKARLVCPEVAGLADDYERGIAAARSTIQELRAAKAAA